MPDCKNNFKKIEEAIEAFVRELKQTSAPGTV